jgi:arylsulfatase A-like enzyme
MNGRRVEPSSWGRLAPVTVALCLLAAGCIRDEPPADRSPGYGELVTRDVIHVLPSRHWTHEDGRWRFHAAGGFHVYVAGEIEGPLRIRLTPHAVSARYELDMSWDGEPLGTLQPLGEGESWDVAIEAERLGPGLHELLLERDYRRDQERLRVRRKESRRKGTRPPGGRRLGLETEMLAVEATWGDRRWSLAPAKLARSEMLRDFLLQGIAGPGKDLYGGLLFHGPGQWERQLGATGAARLEATVENVSDAAATVRAEWAERTRAEVQIPAGESRFLVLEAPPRGGLLRVTVEGDADGLFLLGEPFVVSREESESPNLVLVSLDTTRRDAVAPYDPEALTPNLAAFARTATVFTNAHATGPWTLPTHASMLTGLWPGEHRAALETPHLPFELDTLPERLRENGYFTAGFAGGYLCHHRFGLGQGMHRYRDPEAFETPADRLTDGVLAFLDRHGGRPLFLFVNYFDPHALFKAPARFEEALGVPAAAAPLRDHPIWGPITRGEGGTLAEAIKGRAPFDESVREYLRRSYRAEVAFMDEQLGRFFDHLKAAGEWDRSMIVVVADHGELLGEGGRFTHAHRLDPELTEIPLLVKWPGQSAGSVVEELVSQVDLFPTLLRAARLPIPDDQRGLLLHPEADRNLARRQRVFMEEHETTPHPLFAEMKVAKDLYGVQERRRRELRWESESRCFDREEGSREWRAVDCPDPAALSLAQLEALLGHGGSRRDEGPVLTAEEEEGLRALGYL